MQNLPGKSARAAFLSPPDEARPHIWWHWVDGHISHEGIVADLDAFQRVGIGAVHIFNIGGVIEKARKDKTIELEKIENKKAFRMGSLEWHSLFRYAREQALVRGIKVIVQSSPGWATIGGPWIQPAETMRRLAWSSSVVSGGQDVSLHLPFPRGGKGFMQEDADIVGQADEPDFFEPIAIIAIQKVNAKAPEDTGPFQIHASTPLSDHEIALLKDGQFRSRASKEGICLKNHETGQDHWFEFEYSKPVTLHTLQIALFQIDYFQALDVFIESKDVQGNWLIQRKTLIHVLDSSITDPLRTSLRFSPTTARNFRVRFVAKGPVDIPGSLFQLRWSGNRMRLDQWENRTGFSALAGLAPLPASLPTEPTATQVIDLTDQVNVEGKLTWSAPAGTWEIYNFGSVPTGEEVGPAPFGGDGLETDKLSKQAMRTHITAGVEPIVKAPNYKKAPLAGLLVDSWEANTQTWTAEMESLFQKENKYSIRQWLPALAGEILVDQDATERFLQDFRATVAKLTVEATYEDLARYARSQDIQFFSEAPGVGTNAVIDRFAALGKVDVPMAEFWFTPDPSRQENQGGDIMAAVSAGAIYGKKMVAAEALTSIPEFAGFRFAPQDYKRHLDREFARGISQVALHSAVHQPHDTLKPGLSLLDFGAEFHRNNGWFDELMPEWMAYISRIQGAYQASAHSAELFYYLGEEVPQKSPILSQLTPRLPHGLQATMGGPDALQQFQITEEGVLLKNGQAVHAIILPNHSRMSPVILERLHILVNAGATIYGDPPNTSYGLADRNQRDKDVARLVETLWGTEISLNPMVNRKVGKGRVVRGYPLADILTELQPPSLAMASKLLSHRRATDDGGHLLFVVNPTDDALEVELMHTASLQVEWWDPLNGFIKSVGLRRNKKNKNDEDTQCYGVLEPGQSAILFMSKLKNVHNASECDALRMSVNAVNEPWEVSLTDGNNVVQMFNMNNLVPLTQHPDIGVRQSIGTVTYRTAIKAVPAHRGSNLYLDLGEVGIGARITFGQSKSKWLWAAPFRIEIDPLELYEGQKIEVEVVTCLGHALFADRDLPADKKRFWSTYSPEKPPERPNGLIGPVTWIVENAHTA
jgi:hypothetical protein